ncbi:MAG: hypothetical protein R6U38_09800 [Desulfatiglandaceae bacterium]
MEHFVFTGYVIDFMLYGGVLLSAVLRQSRLSRSLAVLAVAANAALLAIISMVSGQAPVFDILGGLLLVCFVLGLLGTFWRPMEEDSLSVRTWVWIEVLLLLGVTLFFPKTAPPYMYRHNDVWVVLFHGFRCLALSFALFSAAHFIPYRLAPVRKRIHNQFKQGRNFLLLSALFFLCGEYAGMIWCQKGWGDFWHWSPAFFQSTVIILCLMFAFHIPGKNRRSDDLRSIMAVLVPLVMLTVKVIKGLP